ncbi:MAG: riboflavin synthase [Patescibacteria group bacterium]
MFTGIVKGLGRILAVDNRPDYQVLKIEVGVLVPNPTIGGSVAVSGVCLTITNIEPDGLTFEVMSETLRLSTFGSLKVGDSVCIETPLRIGDELGGHLVQGHVDGTAEILSKDTVGENTRVRFWVSSEVGQQIVHKGSITLDGVSLTVCEPVAYPELQPGSTCPQTFCFDVYVLPHTLAVTTLGQKSVGEKVNVEVDYLLKAFLSRLPKHT